MSSTAKEKIGCSTGRWASKEIRRVVGAPVVATVSGAPVGIDEVGPLDRDGLLAPLEVELGDQARAVRGLAGLDALDLGLR